jgi:hypothetical protein
MVDMARTLPETSQPLLGGICLAFYGTGSANVLTRCLFIERTESPFNSTVYANIRAMKTRLSGDNRIAEYAGFGGASAGSHWRISSAPTREGRALSKF